MLWSPGIECWSQCAFWGGASASSALSTQREDYSPLRVSSFRVAPSRRFYCKDPFPQLCASGTSPCCFLLPLQLFPFGKQPNSLSATGGPAELLVYTRGPLMQTRSPGSCWGLNRGEGTSWLGVICIEGQGPSQQKGAPIQSGQVGGDTCVHFFSML